jgi:hypothetical protein
MVTRDVKYTKEDMRLLHNMSKEGSIIRDQLEDLNFDPVLFKEMLESYGLKNEIHYLYELPFEELALYIHKIEGSGYIDFRFRIQK